MLKAVEVYTLGKFYGELYLNKAYKKGTLLQVKEYLP